MFKDREEAGKLLCEELTTYAFENPVVMSIPRGGVEVGFHIASEMDCDYSIIIVKKLTYPKKPDSVFGALAEDGSLYLNSRAREPITKKEIENGIKKAKKVIDRRISLYSIGRYNPEIKGRSVIIVDEGIASGSTVMAAIDYCRKKGAGKLIVAAPVASPQIYKILKDKVDDAVILNLSSPFYTISQMYRNFTMFGDNEVLKHLKIWKARRKLIESLSV